MNLWDGFEPVLQEYQNFQAVTYAWKKYRDTYRIVWKYRVEVSRYVLCGDCIVTALQPMTRTNFHDPIDVRAIKFDL